MNSLRSRVARLENCPGAGRSIVIDRGDHPDPPPAGAVVLKLPKKCGNAEEWIAAWGYLSAR
jgi:hypothetical protein